MRISENMRYRLFQSCINKVGLQLADIEGKISTGKNINAPSDDPIVFARSVEYDSELCLGNQFNDNLERLKTLVGMYDSSLANIEGELANLSVMANTFGTADPGLRQSYVENVRNIIEHLVTVGNTKLGDSYIFGGQEAGHAPFQLNNDYSVSYNVALRAQQATNIYVDKNQLGQFGLSGRDALYAEAKIAFGDVSNAYHGAIYSNTDSFAYVIAGGNRTILLNGTAADLAPGVYTGASLAKEIQSKLGAAYSVAFDSDNRKFSIMNKTGAPVTLNWSSAAATAASTLGFDASDSIVGTGETAISDLDSGRKSFLVKIGTGGTTGGALGTRATYQYSVDDGVTWSAPMTVSTAGADAVADITINGTNNVLYCNGTALTITNGTYTGDGLAAEIEARLSIHCSVSYDAQTRKFAITNNTGTIVNLNWSNSAATAAGVLGFDTFDSILSDGDRDISDYDAGMFIDGSGVATTINNRIKLAFGTSDTPLAANDRFQVKDLNIFELLKNFKDAFEAGNDSWVEKNIVYIEAARSSNVKTNAVVSFQGAKADMFLENNIARKNRIEAEKSILVNADMAELGAEFNILLNTYQTLLAAFSKMQSISILNYLR